MSDYDKNFLKDKYKELEKDLSKPEVRQPNDHILLIDDSVLSPRAAASGTIVP